MEDKKMVKESVKYTAQNIENTILKRLGQFFYDKRNAKNYSVRRLSDLSGVSSAVISDLENYKSMPRIETIIKLALALDITDMNMVFSETFLDNKNSTVGAWGALKQCLLNLDYSNSDIHRIRQYLRFITYLRNNPDSCGIISRKREK